MHRIAPFLMACAWACAPGLAFGQPSAYDQPYRPQFHFSPRQHWTNDPNGLVYFDGEYHLFYQYNPFGDVWGHMSWGHAVSRDLVHWQELPAALPEENGIMIFTGSTVVDQRNTSGFCAGGRPCMVAVYTGHTPPGPGHPALQTQNVAYSNDRGRTWTKYSGNPVLNLHLSDFRDPHVFWSDRARRWIMAVALPNEHKVLFYGSADLKTWQRLSPRPPIVADPVGEGNAYPSAAKRAGGLVPLLVRLRPDPHRIRRRGGSLDSRRSGRLLPVLGRGEYFQARALQVLGRSDLAAQSLEHAFHIQMDDGEWDWSADQRVALLGQPWGQRRGRLGTLPVHRRSRLAGPRLPAPPGWPGLARRNRRPVYPGAGGDN